MKTNKLFSLLNIEFLFSGKYSLNKKYIKLKANKNISKYELKSYFFDIYNIKIFRIHSNIIRLKQKNLKQKKIFWILI